MDKYEREHYTVRQGNEFFWTIVICVGIGLFIGCVVL